MALTRDLETVLFFNNVFTILYLFVYCVISCIQFKNISQVFIKLTRVNDLLSCRPSGIAFIDLNTEKTAVVSVLPGWFWGRTFGSSRVRHAILELLSCVIRKGRPGSSLAVLSAQCCRMFIPGLFHYLSIHGVGSSKPFQSRFLYDEPVTAQ